MSHKIVRIPNCCKRSCAAPLTRFPRKYEISWWLMRCYRSCSALKNVRWAMQVDLVLSSPLKRALNTARIISDYQSIDGSQKPEVQTIKELSDRDWGSSQGRLAQEVCPLGLHALRCYQVTSWPCLYTRASNCDYFPSSTCFLKMISHLSSYLKDLVHQSSCFSTQKMWVFDTQLTS